MHFVVLISVVETIVNILAVYLFDILEC